jgi:ligand-binding sensor domain-containing protein
MGHSQKSFFPQREVFMLRFKSVVAVAVLALGMVSAVNAQAKKTGAMSDEGVVHERPNEFRIYAASSPVKAFAVVKGTLWYATDELVVEQPMNAKTHKPHRTLGTIPSAGVKSIVVDSRGRIWFAGDNGAAMYDGKAFTSYVDELPAKAATSLAAPVNGDVWVGTEGGAARFSNGTWTKFTKKEGLASNKVNALVADSRGNIYIGTGPQGGLTVYDGAKFTTYNAKSSPDGIEWNNVTVLAKEPAKDIIWMADGPNAVSYDAASKKWEQYRETTQGMTSIMNDTYRTWFGHENGVIRFNGELWASKKEEHGIPAEQVFAMYRDEQGNLWFGMEKGVMMLNNPYRR